MASFVVTNVEVLADEFRWTCQTVSVDTAASAEMKRITNMCSGGFEQYTPGFASFALGFSGNADYSGVTVTPADIGSQQIVSMYPDGGAVGGPSILFRGRLANATYPTPVAVGEVAGFELGMESDSPFSFGKVVAPRASYTTAGLTGTAVALTGPAAGRSLYAALHVDTAAGTNLVVKIQSDNGAGFASPTDRITFSTMSAVGSQWSSVAGDLSAETHWRALVTIATGTFTFACSVGVA